MSIDFENNISEFFVVVSLMATEIINCDRVQKDKNGEPVKVRRKKKTYKEIAMLNEMSEEESVRVALQKGYEEMREKLI